MIIDPHVHLRDEEQSYKTTIAIGLKEAKKSGVIAVFDMPNSYSPVTTRKRALERLSIAKRANSSVFYGTYIGLTSDSAQVREAVKTHAELFPKVVGLKLFAGHSVGNLGVIEEGDQKELYESLDKYRGVLVVHCEKEAFLKPELWDAQNPITHCMARPPKAELKSIEDQVKFAHEANFQGTLHIAHISTPEAVNFVNGIRRDIRNLKITCGATPHHLFMYDEMMNGESGLMLKMNPPLRTKKEQEGLLECLRRGEIDWIETDHAPHTEDEKLNPPYMSGIPGLHRWPSVIERLRKMSFSEQQIQNLTFNNVIKTFKLNKNFYM
ncbi:dihydroorotase [Candidatus Pacearchaeota archaeon]|nr:dihydroorotase [Candidatus Pacearchaeota archaeon]